MKILLDYIIQNTTYYCMHLLVTVGTTQFESLITYMDTKQVYQSLQRMGCRQISFQVGAGQHWPQGWKGIIPEGRVERWVNLDKWMNQCDVVICHTGAGTILEALHKDKHVISVVNSTLMDNHQLELYEKLVNTGQIQGIRAPEQVEHQLERALGAGRRRREERKGESPLANLVGQYI